MNVNPEVQAGILPDKKGTFMWVYENVCNVCKSNNVCKVNKLTKPMLQPGLFER